MRNASMPENEVPKAWFNEGLRASSQCCLVNLVQNNLYKMVLCFQCILFSSFNNQAVGRSRASRLSFRRVRLLL